MFQAKPIQPLFRFIGTGSADGSKFLVNGRRGFPLCVCLEQLAGIETGLVKPKEFTRPFRSCSFIQDGIKAGERSAAIRFFFQAKPFLEERLVAPMPRGVTVRCQLVVSINRALIVLRIVSGEFKKNVTLATHRFTFLDWARRAI